MKSSFLFVAFVILLLQVHGQRLAKQSCTQKPVVENFDFSKYDGKWYEVYRYEQPFSFGCSCVTATYTAKQNGEIKVKNCCVRSKTPSCLLGTAVVSYPDKQPLEARLNVTFFGPPKPSNYRVLETDYVNYAAVYNCEDTTKGRSKESFWLLSRSKIISPEVSAKVEALVDKYFDRTDPVFVAAHQRETCANEQT